MFSTSLREKAFWPCLERQIKRNNQRSLRESPRTDFDLALPLSNKDAILYILIVPISDHELHRLDQQYCHFLNPPEPDRKLIVLVNHTYQDVPEAVGTAMYSRIHMQQMTHPDTAPTIVVPSPEQILRHVDTYLEALKSNTRVIRYPSTDPLRLIASATTSAPYQYLTEEQARTVCQICPSIQALEETVSTADGQARLMQLLGEQVAQSMIQFWQDEWIA